MLDGRLCYWTYQDLVANGVAGFITCSGDANCPDRDIDRCRLRTRISRGKKLLGVNVHAEDAAEIVRRDGRHVQIAVDQEERMVQYHNVAMDLPGETEEMVIPSAHYDTADVLLESRMEKDIAFIAFEDRMVNARRFPVARVIPEKLREKIDVLWIASGTAKTNCKSGIRRRLGRVIRHDDNKNCTHGGVFAF